MAETLADLLREVGIDYRSAAVRGAEQAPGPAPLAARDRWQDVQIQPTPRVRQGDYARERQYRVEGARDQFLHGRTLGDRVGAAGTLAANVLPAVAAFPPARQAFRAAQAGDYVSAGYEGGQAALQIAGAGVPARGGALLGRMSRAAPAARAGARAGEAAAEAPRPIPLAIRPQMRASDGSILPGQPRETFGRPFSNTAGTSADLREAARSGGPMRLYRGSTSGNPQIRPNSYWSKDPAYASRQAMGQGVSEGQSVIPADATFRNPYHVRDARESGMVEVPETGGGAAWIESLRARGHDAIIDDIGNQVYVLDANSVQPAIRQQAPTPRPQHDPMPAAIPSGARDMGNLGKPWRPRNQNDSPVRYYFGEDEAMSYSDGDTWKEISRRINARDWEMQDVRLEDLTAGGQDIIEPGFRRVPWPDGYGNGPPVIIRHRGRMYIEDGNHRLTALAERGVPSARMAVIDMDAAPAPRPQHDPMQGGTPSRIPSKMRVEVQQPPGQLGSRYRLELDSQKNGFITVTDGGDVWRVNNSHLDPDLRNQGHGVRLYEDLVLRAREAGARTLRSDNSVSTDAQNAWMGLQRRGYPVARIETPDGPRFEVDLGAPRPQHDPMQGGGKAFRRSRK